jgi:hypothetical protein
MFDNPNTSAIGTTLVAATALTFTLLTSFGISSDRLPALLNTDGPRALLIAAVILAIIAIGCGLVTPVISTSAADGTTKHPVLLADQRTAAPCLTVLIPGAQLSASPTSTTGV